MSYFSVALAAVVFIVLWFTHRIYQFINLHFLIPTPSAQLRRYKPESSEPTSSRSSNASEPVTWALVTAASGGIGYGYASHLLSLNFGVIILAHSGVPTAISRLLTKYPNASIKGVTMDSITATTSDISKLVSSIENLAITILINNVGSMPMEFPHLRPFAEYTTAGIDDTMNLNARFMTHLTRALLPHLTRNAKTLGCRSLVLNVASGARVGLPYVTLYCATKGYVSSFSHTLTREFKYLNSPIDCLLIVPGDVHSDGNCHGVAKGSPRALEYGKMVLERVDGAVQRGLLEVSPYWVHALQIWMLDRLPESVRGRELARVMEGKRGAYLEAYEKAR
ncbi:NAD(P)-binding protein [Lophiostoma macrostomum CBS 122681]|uniref:NAD(P)-binding protein n=1 Tax=Lophiostoma macrostomum CBS 122681 TaxID=1314788 RepID=A0A6A6SMS2_9PLEO|nr:NAD(P)-binding protein [Lophiostoma macrostomum CBS 122681]